MPIFPIIAALLVIEGLAFWWMHPAPSGLGQPVLSWTSPDPTLTDRPDIYAQSAPGLRCASGQIRAASQTDGSNVFLGFFAWDATSSTGDVLEAFRHQPEDCLGYIGLKLVQVAPPRTFVVGTDTLTFEHTILRHEQPNAGLVHAFKAVWVSGTDTGTSRQGILGGDQFSLRSIRYRAALQRFRPAHTRVVQGAVHGVTSPDHAWDVFRAAILDDLEMQPAQAPGDGSSVSAD